MKILYFANLKEVIGKSEDFLTIHKKLTVFDVVEKLKKKGDNYQKAFSNLKNIKCAVNYKYTDYKKKVVNKDEVAFFPPVTGG